jgi:hypothetical protein
VTAIGTSSRQLAEKLGIKPGSRVALLGAPPGYAATLGPLPIGVVARLRLGGDPFDLIQLFTRTLADLERRLPALERALEPDGALWISWPKRAAKIATDVTEDVVRDVALPRGLVDVKVCAVDAVWSALKLVVRVENRKSWRMASHQSTGRSSRQSMRTSPS